MLDPPRRRSAPRWAVIAELALVAALLGVGPTCAPGFRSHVPAPREPRCQADVGRGGVLARLARTACLGPCPVYSATLCADGTVVYDGKIYVKRSGRHVRRLEPAALRAVVVLLDRAPDGRGPLEDPVLADVPWAHLAHYRSGARRWVALEAVAPFERAIGLARWVGTPRERQRLDEQAR